MPAPKFKIFISYFSKDEEFTNRLAQLFREKDVTTWIDKDLRAGRWDDAIQRAMDESNCLLVVLSPDAVASQNVKDEYSYALDEGKKIIPVLYKTCSVPYRLRRFQHFSISADVETGINDIIEAISKAIPKSALSEDKLPDIQKLKPLWRNLVFEGSGSKSLAYTGSLEVLSQERLLDNIVRVGGSSFGGIVAAMLAIGLAPLEIQNILRDADFDKFLDNDWGIIRNVQELYFSYLLSFSLASVLLL